MARYLSTYGIVDSTGTGTRYWWNIGCCEMSIPSADGRPSTAPARSQSPLTLVRPGTVASGGRLSSNYPFFNVVRTPHTASEIVSEAIKNHAPVPPAPPRSSARTSLSKKGSPSPRTVGRKVQESAGSDFKSPALFHTLRISEIASDIRLQAGFDFQKVPVPAAKRIPILCEMLDTYANRTRDPTLTALKEELYCLIFQDYSTGVAPVHPRTREVYAKATPFFLRLREAEKLRVSAEEERERLKSTMRDYEVRLQFLRGSSTETEWEQFSDHAEATHARNLVTPSVDTRRKANLATMHSPRLPDRSPRASVGTSPRTPCTPARPGDKHLLGPSWDRKGSFFPASVPASPMPGASARADVPKQPQVRKRRSHWESFLKPPPGANVPPPSQNKPLTSNPFDQTPKCPEDGNESAPTKFTAAVLERQVTQALKAVTSSFSDLDRVLELEPIEVEDFVEAQVAARDPTGIDELLEIHAEAKKQLKIKYKARIEKIRSEMVRTRLEAEQKVHNYITAKEGQLVQRTATLNSKILALTEQLAGLRSHCRSYHVSRPRIYREADQVETTESFMSAMDAMRWQFSQVTSKKQRRHVSKLDKDKDQDDSGAPQTLTELEAMVATEAKLKEDTSATLSDVMQSADAMRRTHEREMTRLLEGMASAFEAKVRYAEWEERQRSVYEAARQRQLSREQRYELQQKLVRMQRGGEIFSPEEAQALAELAEEEEACEAALDLQPDAFSLREFPDVGAAVGVGDTDDAPDDAAACAVDAVVGAGGETATMDS